MDKILKYNVREVVAFYEKGHITVGEMLNWLKEITTE